MSAFLLISMLTAMQIDPPAFWAANEELRGYLIEAGDNNPGLRARHTEWLASLEVGAQVTTLDDPMFTFGYFLQSDMYDYKVMLAQKFPSFGTLRIQGEQAIALADAALERVYDERNSVFAQVKKAYFDYAFLAESIEVTKAQVEVLGYMEDIVRSKYESGLTNEDDLLRISIEKTKVQDRHDGFVQFTPALLAQLNEAIGTTSRTQRPWPQKSDFPPDIPPMDEVLVDLKATNPALKRLDALIESRQKQVQLAKKKGNPNFTLGIEYMEARPDSLADGVLASFSINLPIWRKKIRAGVSEAQYFEKTVSHEKQQKTLSLGKTAEMAVFTVQDAQRRYRLFESTLLPQAQQTYDSLLSRYATGLKDSSFIDVLDSIQTLLAFELEQVRAARDWQIGAAELEFLLGKPWKS